MIEITCNISDRVDYKSIKPFQGDLKSLSKENYDKLHRSIQKHGFFVPIGVWEHDGVLNCLDGHQRIQYLSKRESEGESIPLVPIFRVQADTLRQAKEKLMQLVSQFGRVEKDGLYEFMIENDFKIEDTVEWDLPNLDMDSFLIEFFEDNTVEPGCDEDEVPEAPPEPKTKLGDIYQLGNHRLMCGDSTSITDVEKLMNGEKADMVFTDPPYGISHSGKGIDGSSNGNDFGEILGDGDVSVAIDAVNLARAIVPDGTLIFWGANYFPSCLSNGHGWIVWDKQREGNTFSGAEIAFVNRGVRVDVFRHQWHGMIKSSERGEARVHPTQKPIALAEWCFENYGNPKSVIDLFGGSGSTLIACEKSNRKCFMMELDQKYCDVIVSRWEKFTGKTAVLIS